MIISSSTSVFIWGSIVKEGLKAIDGSAPQTDVFVSWGGEAKAGLNAELAEFTRNVLSGEVERSIGSIFR
ncbi:MAG TPA: hypothetical protein VFC02_24135 [Anaerolineales bacterium]|nr:hypothetical protein [Anaerolineales bacterium]